VTPRRALRIGLGDAAAGAAAVLLFPAFIALRADANQIIEPQRMDYALLLVAVLLIATGAQLMPWPRARYVAFLAALAGAALLFSILGAFGIGLAVLPVAILALLLLYRALRRGPLAAARPAAIGGALAGYGAILLYIALIVPATVECRPNGGGTSSGRWGGGGVTFAEGGLQMGADGVMTGTLETPDSVVRFRCEQGRIVEFRREPR
jgi:hypothetical protein